MPSLRLYGNGSSSAVVVLTATSISSDGMHATFPYPLLSGSTLPPNLYSWSLINQGPSGHQLAGNDWLAVGQADTSFATPFGVDAGSFSEFGTLCHPPTGGGKKGSCSTVDTLINFPIVTLYNLGELKYNGEITPVGTHPTVVRAYNRPVTKVSDSYGGSVTITQTGNALVVNTGSNNVSIVNLVTHFIVATIAVGSQPVDARVSSDNSTAYVVNYGSGTVTVISLTSNIVTNTISVGSQPTTISLDGNGDAWIGGNNFVAQLNLSSFAITSHAVNGLVNGIAYSNGQGQVLTTIAPSTDSASLSAISYRPSSGYSQAAAVTSSGALSAYSNSSMDSELLWPAQLSTGTLVSNQLNNMIGVTVSGASFAVTDLHSGAAMLTGQAPGTIRGLAVDSAEGIVYMTIPDSNQVISTQIPAPITPPTGVTIF
ncbi:MAG: YncE family protein [Acidobacteriaceae bacterium]